MPPQHRTTIWVAVSSALFACPLAHAQIRTDGTLGAAQALAGPAFAIPADLGKQAGANLFHSFAQFSVPTGNSATFTGPNSVANIISRVTGTDTSSIDGRLASTIPRANLFLINPRGIVFGPNASLDLTGSFYASTANYLKLADGTKFDATATVPAVLSMTPPAAFGFLGPTGAITVQGSQLQAAPGQSINLVGGPITVSDASLRTIAGNIRLVGVGGTGEVSLGGGVTAGTPLAPVLIQRSELATESADGATPGRILIRGGQITVLESSLTSTNNEQVDAPPVELAASGDLTVSASSITSQTGWSGRGADITLSGENVTVDHNSQVGSITWGDGRGGDVIATAQNEARVVAAAEDPNYTNVYSWAFGAGAGGDIRLSGDAVTVQSGNLYSYAGGDGAGGSIILRGRDVAVTNGGYVYTWSNWGTSGRTGDIDVVATQRSFTGGLDWYGNQAYVFTQTQASGNAGNIRVVAPAIDVIGGTVQSLTFGAGNAGSLRLDGDVVRILGGNGGVGMVDTTVAGGSSGNGGNIDVRATTSVEISRADYWDWTRLATSTFSTGRGGDVTVDAPTITVRDRASIWTGAFDAGRAGDIRLRGQDVNVVGTGKIEAVVGGSGRGGDIDIAASRRFYTSDDLPVPDDYHADKGIYSYTVGQGDAGNIRIAAPEITIVGGGVHSITYGGGNAGSLRFDGEVIRVLGGNGGSSLIESSTSDFTTGNGGSIEIRATRAFELSGVGFPTDWTRIAATTQANGRGGDIIIESPSILIDKASVFSRTRFGTGEPGSITVRANELTLKHLGNIVSGTEGDRNGSSILIDAGVINASDDAAIASVTNGSGNAGRVTINAQRVKLTGASRIEVDSGTGSGNAGDIVLNIGESLEISERAVVPSTNLFSPPELMWLPGLSSRARTRGDAGNIFVRAPSILLDDGRILSTALASGQGGRVEIHADGLIMRNGAQIDANSAPGSTGDAGSIDIQVAGRFDIAGLSPIDGAFSGLYVETQGSGRGGNIAIGADTLVVDRGLIRSSTGASGNAGTIRIQAGDIVLANGAWIDAGTAAGSTGAGGSIDVAATRSIVVRGIDTNPIIRSRMETVGLDITPGTPGRLQGAFPSTVSSNTAGAGPGGNVTLSAPSIRIEDGSKVSANSTSTGAAGSISIAAADALRIFGGTISSEALNADGGNIDIRVGNLVHLRDAEITTSVGSGEGAGGNIFIDPTFVILENSRIVANAFGGSGGNIRILAQYLLNSPGSLIEASSQLGASGSVQIAALNTNLANELAALPVQVLDASAMLRDSCTVRAASGGAGSSLVGVGRGGLAASPKRFAASSYFIDAAGSGSGVSAESSSTGLKLRTAQRARLIVGCPA